MYHTVNKNEFGGILQASKNSFCSQFHIFHFFLGVNSHKMWIFVNSAIPKLCIWGAEVWGFVFRHTCRKLVDYESALKTWILFSIKVFSFPASSSSSSPGGDEGKAILEPVERLVGQWGRSREYLQSGSSRPCSCSPFSSSCSSLPAQLWKWSSHWAPPSLPRQSFPWLSSNPWNPTAPRVSNSNCSIVSYTETPKMCQKICILAYLCPP